MKSLDLNKTSLTGNDLLKNSSGRSPFLGVAIHAARHEVSIGIQSQFCSRHNVVQAPPARGDPAQTVKAVAALALVEGPAQDLLFQEVRLLDVDHHAGRGR